MKKLLRILFFPLALLLSMCLARQESDISVEEAAALIQKNSKNKQFTLIDVRTPQEFEQGRLPGAINIDYYADNFASRLTALPSHNTYLVYCRSGSRSADALRKMRETGAFSGLYNMLGGVLAWQSSGRPLIK